MSIPPYGSLAPSGLQGLPAHHPRIRTYCEKVSADLDCCEYCRADCGPSHPPGPGSRQPDSLGGCGCCRHNPVPPGPLPGSP